MVPLSGVSAPAWSRESFDGVVPDSAGFGFHWNLLLCFTSWFVGLGWLFVKFLMSCFILSVSHSNRWSSVITASPVCASVPLSVQFIHVGIKRKQCVLSSYFHLLSSFDFVLSDSFLFSFA